MRNSILFEFPAFCLKVPAKKQGKSATMPPLSKQVSSSEPDGTDSGGTFMSFNSSSSQPPEELSDYEMMPDHGSCKPLALVQVLEWTMKNYYLVLLLYISGNETKDASKAHYAL